MAPKRKASKRPTGPTRCHYCERTFEPHRIEMDHFPVPVANGGTEVVPACIPCHDHKDRVTALNWSVEEREDAYEQIAFLLGAAGIWAEIETRKFREGDVRSPLVLIMERLRFEDVQAFWPWLRLPARLFVAKMLRMRGEPPPRDFNARMREREKKQQRRRKPRSKDRTRREVVPR